MSIRSASFGFTKLLRNRPVYAALGVLGVGFWAHTVWKSTNTSRAHNPIFKAVMFHMRHDPAVVDLLGDGIFHDDEKHSAVRGKVNFIQGSADMEFEVEGSKAHGTVRFRGQRIPGSDCWQSRLFEIEGADGQRVSL
ncbi:cytochrome oxidase assembly protein 1 [Entophlyctis helioformis]|nr:cytochrome oxidase assembly protein 1 [Entophlyctis helioformis]